jgi:hypothetical protein
MSFHKLSTELKQKALDMGFVPMFASRDSIGEAKEYFETVMESLNPSDRIAVYTAIQVLENTKILFELEVQTDDIFGA